VARVIAALPMTEQQRLWVRTIPSAVEAIAAALRDSGASSAALAARSTGRTSCPHYPRCRPWHSAVFR
jgi:hypothetical protein